MKRFSTMFFGLLTATLIYASPSPVYVPAQYICHNNEFHQKESSYFPETIPAVVGLSCKEGESIKLFEAHNFSWAGENIPTEIWTFYTLGAAPSWLMTSVFPLNQQKFYHGTGKNWSWDGQDWVCDGQNQPCDIYLEKP